MKTLATIALGTLLATGTAIADSNTTIINRTSAFLHIATFDKKDGEHLSDTTCAGTMSYSTPKTCSVSVPDNAGYIRITGDYADHSELLGVSSASGFANKTVSCFYRTLSGWTPIGLNCRITS